MTQTELGRGYLSPRAKLEPLVGGWYAWPHLLAPHARAMNLLHRQLALLESFVNSPSLHVSASADPMLYGGNFVDLPIESRTVARQALEDARRERAGELRMAGQIRELDQLVGSFALGQPLDELYARLPEELQGLVEFHYSANGTPFFRLREALMYRSQPGAPLQGFMLYPAKDNDRLFFLNTPRLAGPEDSVRWESPFRNPELDMLSRSRRQESSVGDIAAALGLDEQGRKTLARLFTEDGPAPVSPSMTDEGVRIRYFGHACVLVQTKDVSILIDPTFAHERDDDLATLTLSDLPDRIDHVFISHGHQDHLCPEILLQIRPLVHEVVVPQNNPGDVADPSLKLMLRELGYENVRSVEDLDSFDIPGGRVTSIPFPGEHSDLGVYSKSCIHIRLGEQSMMFLVDSDAADPVLYKRIREQVGTVDTLFIGMECEGAPLSWLYGPLLLRPVSRRNDQSRRGKGSGSDRAWAVVEALGCRRAFIYAMGLEPWNRHLLGLDYQSDSIQLKESDLFVARCRAAGIESDRLRGCREMRL